MPIAHFARHGRLASLVWMALALALLFVFFVGGTYPFLGSPLVRAMTQALLWVVTLGWLMAWLRGPSWAPTAEVLLILSPGLAAGLVSALFATSVRLSLEAWYWACLLSFALLALTRIAAHDGFRVRIRGLIVVLFVSVAVGYLVQLTMSWLDWFRTISRVAGLPLHPGGASLTFGAAPVVAIVLLILGPPACAILIDVRRGRWIVAALAVVAAFDILATGSRSGYLAAAVEGGLLIGIAGRSGISAVLRALPRWALGVGAVGAVAVGVGLVGAIAPRLLDASTINERWAIWQSAFNVWLGSPWIGAGAGLWPYLRAGAYPVGSPSLVVPHAHNPAIQLVAETGIIGLAAVGVGVAVLIRGLLRRAQRGGRDSRSLAMATLVSLIAFGTGSILDDFVNLPCVLLAVVLPIAVVLGDSDGTQSPRRSVPQRLVAPLAILMIGMALAGWQMNAAALTAQTGVVEANAGDWPAARVQFAAAAAIDPQMPLYRIELATALSMGGDLDSAWRELQSVGEADGTPVVLLERAWIAYDRGDQVASKSAVALAYQRSAGDAAALVNVGALAERLADPTLATTAYADAIVASPVLAASETLKASPLYSEVLRRAITDAALTSAIPFQASLIRAYGGSSAEVAGELAPLASGGPRDRALAVALALTGKLADAQDVLASRLASDPVDGQTAELLAQLDLEAGQVSAAQRYGRWAQLVGVGSAAIGLASGSDILTVREAGTSNLASNYPWVIYGRYGPNVLLPPNALAIKP